MTKTTAAGPKANRTILMRTLFLMVVCGVVAFIPLFIRLYSIQIVQHDGGWRPRRWISRPGTRPSPPTGDHL